MDDIAPKCRLSNKELASCVPVIIACGRARKDIEDLQNANQLLAMMINACIVLRDIGCQLEDPVVQWKAYVSDSYVGLIQIMVAMGLHALKEEGSRHAMYIASVTEDIRGREFRDGAALILQERNYKWVHHFVCANAPRLEPLAYLTPMSEYEKWQWYAEEGYSYDAYHQRMVAERPVNQRVLPQ